MHLQAPASCDNRSAGPGCGGMHSNAHSSTCVPSGLDRLRPSHCAAKSGSATCLRLSGNAAKAGFTTLGCYSITDQALYSFNLSRSQARSKSCDRQVEAWPGAIHNIVMAEQRRTCIFSMMPVPIPILTLRPLNSTSDAARWTARSALSTVLVEVLMQERWCPISSVGQGAVNRAC